jgi:hypothetical protein
MGKLMNLDMLSPIYANPWRLIPLYLIKFQVNIWFLILFIK